MKRIPTWAAFVIPIPLTLMLVFSVWSDLHRFQQKTPFIETSGHIANVECQNHGRYQVSFGVGDHVLTVDAGNIHLRQACADRRAGEAVDVWYSEFDPTYASFISPAEAMSHMKGELVSAMLIPYPVFAAFLFVVSKLQNKTFSFRRNKSSK